MSDAKTDATETKPEEHEVSLPGESISPEELVLRKAIRLIDVRTPAEFAQLHAEGAINIPLDRLDPAEVLNGSNEAVYLICRGGSRSREAANRIRAAMPGCSALVVEGGTLGWLDAGLPVVRGERRRKRLKTGSYVVGAIFVVSTLLAIFVHRACWASRAGRGVGIGGSHPRSPPVALVRGVVTEVRGLISPVFPRNLPRFSSTFAPIVKTPAPDKYRDDEQRSPCANIGDQADERGRSRRPCMDDGMLIAKAAQSGDVREYVLAGPVL